MTNDDSPKSLYIMRKRPKQARSKATVDAILTAASQVLLETGYYRASTYKIADLAGVSTGSLYEYFPGKEAIFAEVRRREDKKLLALVMEQPVPTTVKELLRLHTSTNIQFVRSNLRLHAALINDVPQFAVTEEELPAYTDYFPWGVQFFHTHKEEIRQDLSADRLVEFIMRVVRSTIDSYVLNAPDQLNDPSIEKLIIDLIERFALRN